MSLHTLFRRVIARSSRRPARKSPPPASRIRLDSLEARVTPAVGTIQFQEMVWPKMWLSQPGMIRRSPSGQPMYQSGCEPAVTLEGS